MKIVRNSVIAIVSLLSTQMKVNISHRHISFGDFSFWKINTEFLSLRHFGINKEERDVILWIYVKASLTYNDAQRGGE